MSSWRFMASRISVDANHCGEATRCHDIFQAPAMLSQDLYKKLGNCRNMPKNKDHIMTKTEEILDKIDKVD